MVQIGPLLQEYKNEICKWEADFLSNLISEWCEAYGKNMSENEVKRHIETNHLCDNEWQELIDASHDDIKYVCCAVIDGKPIGVVYAELREDRYVKCKLGVISWIYVQKDFRRQGISKILLSEVNEWMKTKNALAAEVFVTLSNIPAIGAYKGAEYIATDCRMARKV